jgi:hypothetical protein
MSSILSKITMKSISRGIWTIHRPNYSPSLWGGFAFSFTYSPSLESNSEKEDISSTREGHFLWAFICQVEFITKTWLSYCISYSCIWYAFQLCHQIPRCLVCLLLWDPTLFCTFYNWDGSLDTQKGMVQLLLACLSASMTTILYFLFSSLRIV